MVGKFIRELHSLTTYVNTTGATSAAVIANAFDLYGYSNYSVLINKREYGNGINDRTIDYLKLNPNVKLVVTADHASSNNYHLGLIKELGIETIVTDHHQLKDDTPPSNATTFVNPQQDDDTYFKCLSGCAVAYFTMYWLLESVNKHSRMKELLDLVAISTIGDMMKLDDPVNRVITNIGLKELNNSKLGDGFKEKLKIEHIDSRDISFLIVPMINSCSRVDDSIIAYISLLDKRFKEVKTTDSVILDNIEYLGEVNDRRKVSTNKLMDIANRQVKVDESTNIILLPATSTGLNGIIASRLCMETKKPSVVFINGSERAAGSCRGFIPTLNVKACFDKIHSIDSSIFIVENNEAKYGGHEGAAGCTVYPDKILRFQELFNQYVKELNFDTKELARQKVANAIDISEISNVESELRSINTLAPFGNGWETPLLLVKPESIKNIKKIFLPGNTVLLKFTVCIEDVNYDFAMFHNINQDVELRGSDILCTATIKKTIKFNVVDLVQ